MLKNHLKVSVRNLLRNKLFSAINTIGLAIGLTSAILLSLFIKNELTYDSWWANSERIYHIEGQYAGEERSATPAPLAAALTETFPNELQAAARIAYGPSQIIKDGEEYRQSVQVVDSAILDIFDFEFLEGDAKNALTQPDSIILTAATAKKYFGETPALGQTLSISLFDNGSEYQVTGVIADLPENSNLYLTLLLNAGNALDAGLGPVEQQWRNPSLHTYLLLHENADAELVRSGLPAMLDRWYGTMTTGGKMVPASGIIQLYLTNITDMHLTATKNGAIKERGDARTLEILGLITALIIVIAAINFVNLTLSQNLRRVKGAAIRKLHGANRWQISQQYLVETVILTGISLLIAVSLVELSLPWFNQLTERLLVLNYANDPLNLIGLAGLLATVGIGAGMIPAFAAASIRPAQILQGSGQASSPRSKRIHGGMVVFQFAIASAFIVCALVVSAQLYFATHKDLGFNPDNVAIVLAVGSEQNRASLPAFRAQLENNPAVLATSLTSNAPGFESRLTYYVSDLQQASADADQIGGRAIGPNFFGMYQIDLLAGREFSDEHAIDPLVTTEMALASNQPVSWRPQGSIILNESALDKLGIGSPVQAIGRQFKLTDDGNNTSTVTVIGVVRDTHYGSSVSDQIQPALYVYDAAQFALLSIKYQNASFNEIRQLVDSEWTSPDIYGLESLDQEILPYLYRQLKAQSLLLGLCSGLAVMICCLGLLGLSAFEAERRTKEIGIRKAMGASLFNILRSLIWQFSKPILAANLLAMPVSWYFMKDWLSGFVDHISLTPMFFIGGTILTIVIAWITVFGHTVRAARASPVAALRYE